MNAATGELLRRGVHALQRSTFWWTFGLVWLTGVSVAFWPSLEGTESFDDLLESSPELMEAFGASDFSTAAGYLDGQLYALMLPLLLSGMAVAMATAVTAGDEDAGRLELVHALPVSRRAVWLARLGGALAVLLAVTVLTAVLVAASIGPFSLDGLGVGRVVSATFAAGALAAFHVSIAYAVGAAGGSRGLAVGVSLGVLFAGYVANYLLPLVDALEGLDVVSPWHWATGKQPLSEGISGLRVAVLLAVTAALVAIGTAAVERRDIKNA